MNKIAKLVKFIAVGCVMLMLIVEAVFNNGLPQAEKSKMLALFWILVGIYWK